MKCILFPLLVAASAYGNEGQGEVPLNGQHHPLRGQIPAAPGDVSARIASVPLDAPVDPLALHLGPEDRHFIKADWGAAPLPPQQNQPQ